MAPSKERKGVSRTRRRSAPPEVGCNVVLLSLPNDIIKGILRYSTGPSRTPLMTRVNSLLKQLQEATLCRTRSGLAAEDLAAMSLQVTGLSLGSVPHAAMAAYPQPVHHSMNVNHSHAHCVAVPATATAD